MQPKVGDIVRVQGVVEDIGGFGRVAIRFINHKRLAWLEADMVKEIMWTPRVGAPCGVRGQAGCVFRIVAFDAPYAVVHRTDISVPMPAIVFQSELCACAA